MKAKKKPVMIAAVVLVLLLALIVAYGVWYLVGGRNPYKEVFYPGTTLNKIDISEKSVDEVIQMLETKSGEYELTVVFKGEQLTVAASDIGMKYNTAVDIQVLKDQQNKVEYKEISPEQLQLQEEGLFSYDKEALKKLLSQCTSMDASRMVAPENAKLVYDEKKNAFSLKDGNPGTTLNGEVVQTAVQTAINHLEETLNIEEADLYELAALRADSENAKEILEEAGKYLNISLKYIFNKEKEQEEIIDSKLIGPWIFVDENLLVQVDNDKVQQLVNTYAEAYSSSRVRTDFTTTGGSVISLNVPVGGESIDTNALFEDIIKCLKEKTSGDREVPFTESAVTAGNNFGGNYIEIDLTNQKLYLYKDGSLVMSSNIVSGNVSKMHMTPTGVYQIYSMERDVVLRGADYASPVSYWMPFNGGVGMHDATWRGSFGGSIYKYNGSHGCINMPYEKAKTVYNTAYTGYYVIVYGGVTYVPGQSHDDPKDKETETEKPTETESVTETEPPTTEKPETQPPTTEKPETEPPTTEKPETQPPTTEKPETEPPTTEKPETEPPTTEKPETEPPTTEAPATEAPAPEPPATESPAESNSTEAESNE